MGSKIISKMKKKQKKSATQDIDVTVKSIAEELLSLIGVSAQVEVAFDKREDVYLVKHYTQEAALLIGRHGETLDSLQTIISQIVYKKIGEWKRVLVDTEGYRDKREEALKSLALETAARVKDTGIEQPIYDLTPSERRVVHLSLSEDESVETESVGEGRERHLLIKPKT